MPCPPLKNFAEVVEKLVSLQTRFEMLFNSLDYKRYDDGEYFIDVRAATLVNCRFDIQINIMIMNLFVQVEQGTLPLDQATNRKK